MEEMEKSNIMKVLEELLKNGRASLSELAEKTGLTRQTVTKTINSLEKNKQIWGYTAIFNPELLDFKQFIFLVKLDISINTENLIKKSTDPKLLKENTEKIGFKTSMFTHGKTDVMIITWAKDIIEAKKHMNIYKNIFAPNVKDVELLEVISTFRKEGISNPNLIDE